MQHNDPDLEVIEDEKPEDMTGKLYTSEQIHDHDVIAAELGEQEIATRSNKLDEAERYRVVATMTGDTWTPRQVDTFVQQAASWSNGIAEVKVHVHNYLGLELWVAKTWVEIRKTVLTAEGSRRQSHNWKVERALREADEKKADEA